MNGLGYFLAAYIVTGAGVLAYIVRLCVVRRSLRREVEALRAEAQQKRGG